MPDDAPTDSDTNGHPPDDPAEPAPVLSYASPGAATTKPPHALVTIATFGDSWEARLAAGKLEAEGIPCAVADENIVGVGGGLYGNMVGGIKLQVPAAHADRALAALPPRVRPRVTRCPNCNATETIELGFTPAERPFCLLLLGLPYLFLEKRWLCHACAHMWKGPGGEDRPENDDHDNDPDDEDEEDPRREPPRNN